MHLCDNNESGLFDLAAEISGVSPQTIIKLWPASVVDPRKVNEIFKKHSKGRDLSDVPARVFTGMMTLVDAINRAGSNMPITGSRRS